MAPKEPMYTTKIRRKILIVGVITPYNRINTAEYYFEEFLSLINTLGQEYDEALFFKLRELDKANFLTKGKLQELAIFCEENKIEEIIFSENLTPLQERNIEERTNCEVWDREKLILEIFKKSAHSSEGKIQVEMAELEYEKSRLSGKGVELAQQEGVVGISRGPGETAKEMVKRYLADKFRQARRRLDSLQKARETQRQQRLQSNIPLIGLVGYTNAGKSSLLNILTKSSVLVENKLFATLDTTTREFFIDGKKAALVSDTVGFISQLPHHLIEAFKSTLDELKYATLLLHVIDLSNPTWSNQIEVVNNTLKELDIKTNILHVFNKIDKITEQDLILLKNEVESYTPYVLIHTKSKDGISELVKFLKNYIENKNG